MNKFDRIGIIAVGGYNEMGKNMTGVRIDNDIIVLDMDCSWTGQIHEDVEIDKCIQWIL